MGTMIWFFKALLLFYMIDSNVLSAPANRSPVSALSDSSTPVQLPPVYATANQNKLLLHCGRGSNSLGSSKTYTQWNIPLSADNSKITYSNRLMTMNIVSPGLSESGEYICVITNSQNGETLTFAQVLIIRPVENQQDITKASSFESATKLPENNYPTPIPLEQATSTLMKRIIETSTTAGNRVIETMKRIIKIITTTVAPPMSGDKVDLMMNNIETAGLGYPSEMHTPAAAGTGRKHKGKQSDIDKTEKVHANLKRKEKALVSDQPLGVTSQQKPKTNGLMRKIAPQHQPFIPNADDGAGSGSGDVSAIYLSDESPIVAANQKQINKASDTKTPMKPEAKVPEPVKTKNTQHLTKESQKQVDGKIKSVKQGDGNKKSVIADDGHKASVKPGVGHKKYVNPGNGHKESGKPVDGHQKSVLADNGPKASVKPGVGHKKYVNPGNGHKESGKPVDGHQKSVLADNRPKASVKPGVGHKESVKPSDGHKESVKPVDDIEEGLNKVVISLTVPPSEDEDTFSISRKVVESVTASLTSMKPKHLPEEQKDYQHNSSKKQKPEEKSKQNQDLSKLEDSVDKLETLLNENKSHTTKAAAEQKSQQSVPEKEHLKSDESAGFGDVPGIDMLDETLTSMKRKNLPKGQVQANDDKQISVKIQQHDDKSKQEQDLTKLNKSVDKLELLINENKGSKTANQKSKQEQDLTKLEKSVGELETLINENKASKSAEQTSEQSFPEKEHLKSYESGGSGDVQEIDIYDEAPTIGTKHKQTDMSSDTKTPMKPKTKVDEVPEPVKTKNTQHQTKESQKQVDENKSVEQGIGNTKSVKPGVTAEPFFKLKPTANAKNLDKVNLHVDELLKKIDSVEFPPIGKDHMETVHHPEDDVVKDIVIAEKVTTGPRSSVTPIVNIKPEKAKQHQKFTGSGPKKGAQKARPGNVQGSNKKTGTNDKDGISKFHQYVTSHMMIMSMLVGVSILVFILAIGCIAFWLNRKTKRESIDEGPFLPTQHDDPMPGSDVNTNTNAQQSPEIIIDSQKPVDPFMNTDYIDYSDSYYGKGRPNTQLPREASGIPSLDKYMIETYGTPEQKASYAIEHDSFEPELPPTGKQYGIPKQKVSYGSTLNRFVYRSQEPPGLTTDPEDSEQEIMNGE